MRSGISFDNLLAFAPDIWNTRVWHECCLTPNEWRSHEMNGDRASQLRRMIYALKCATHDINCPPTRGMLTLLERWEDELRSVTNDPTVLQFKEAA